METIIVSLITAAFWLSLRAYMISEERNKREEEELNNLDR